MTICINENKETNGKEAALRGGLLIQKTLDKKGSARIILATGASQFEMISELIKADIDWSKVEVFHLDEYIGIPESHKASFRKYLKERFEAKVSNLKAFHYIQGDAENLDGELSRINGLISSDIIDVAFVGIGENAHLAFNDPPADFETEIPYLVVNLDEECRKQQLNEGWFSSLDDVPRQAVSMSVRQIMKSTYIINTVPDKRKAAAVSCSVNGKINKKCPASILQLHENCYSFFDRESASLLRFDE